MASEILLHGFNNKRCAFQSWVARSLNESGANWATRELCSRLGLATHPQSDVAVLNKDVMFAVQHAAQVRDSRFYWGLMFDNLGWLMKSTATWFHSITCCWLQIQKSGLSIPQNMEPITPFPTPTDFSNFHSNREEHQDNARLLLTTCNNWFTTQRSRGLHLRLSPIMPPVHVMKKLDNVILEDDVDLGDHTDDMHQRMDADPKDEVLENGIDVPLPPSTSSDDMELYQFSYFKRLLHDNNHTNPPKSIQSNGTPKDTSQSKRHQHARVVVDIEPSWIMDLAKKTSTDALLEHAIHCTPPGHPVVLGGDGKPVADLFHTLLSAKAKSLRQSEPYPYERVILALGPMHVKHVLLKCFTTTFRGICNLDDYLCMIGRDTEGKRNFTLGNGDTRVVEDMLYALATAYQLCLRHKYNSSASTGGNMPGSGGVGAGIGGSGGSGSGADTSGSCGGVAGVASGNGVGCGGVGVGVGGLDAGGRSGGGGSVHDGSGSAFENWKQNFERSHAHAAMFAQVADLHCVVSMLDTSVRKKDFCSWLSAFRLLSRLFVCNHNTSYIFIFFEYINQLANMGPDKRQLLSQSFSVSGAGMNIGFDTFVEKINRFYKSKLPSYNIGMINKLRRLSILAKEHFCAPTDEMPEISNFRLKRRANMLTWAVIFINKIGVFDGSVSDGTLGFVPPGDSTLRFRVNIEWSRVLRSNINENSSFPNEHLDKYFSRYYSAHSAIRERYASKRATLPCLPLSHESFHAFISRGESTSVDVVFSLYSVVELRDECRKFSKQDLGLHAPSRALKLELAEAICRARRKLSGLHHFCFISDIYLESLPDTQAILTDIQIENEILPEEGVALDDDDNQEITNDFSHGDNLGKRRREQADTETGSLEKRRTGRMRQPNLEYWKDFVQ